MASTTNDLEISDLRGGMNDQDPPHILPLDQVVLAQNVEYFNSTLGERRLGMEPVSLEGSGLENVEALVHLGLYRPALSAPDAATLFAVGANVGSFVGFAYRDAGAWTAVTPVDAATDTEPDIYQIRSQSIHDKWFVAYNSAVDRMHVWDGTVLRRTGLAAPTAAPTAANSGSGTFAEERFYRVRVVQIVSGTSTVLSEPSPELAFTPSGTGSGVTVTRPTLPGEVETDWILEASSDLNEGNWYQIATVAAATTTYTDTIDPSTDYAEFELSPDIGDYDLVPSARIIKADEDRLIYFGSFEDPELGSRVAWTPAYAAPGIGNDERLPDDIDSFTNLDWQDGGEITDASDPVNGAFYAFKSGRIYKGQRTGNAKKAYSFYLLDPAHGAIYGSVVSGVDEYGRAAVYFVDPHIGPMRVSSSGVQQLQGLGTTWRRVNANATNIAVRGVYYPAKKQVHWWVAFDGSNTPAYKLVLQTNEVQSGDEGGTTRGWTVANGLLTEGISVAIVPHTVFTEEDGVTEVVYKPYVGFSNSQGLMVSDVNSYDNTTAYRAIIRTRPYIQAGLLNKFGVMAAALLASADDNPLATIQIKVIRDFGLESIPHTTDLVPDSTEDPVIKFFDDFVMSSARALQFEFSDPE